MKALVIENEHTVDESIQAFLKDNPKLFSSVNEQTFCNQRSLSDLQRFIAEADAIVIASTFGSNEKAQVEEYVDAFTGSARKMKFFIHSFIRELNSWGYEDPIWFDDRTLFEKVRDLVRDGHELYDFSNDFDDSDKVVDDLNIFHKEEPRNRYTFRKIYYSTENDVFYIDHKFFNEKIMIEERQEYLDKKKSK